MESLIPELNRAHFDSEAANYDAKHVRSAEEIARRINAKLDLIGVDWVQDGSSDEEEDKAGGGSEREVRLLDYACGTGSMSRVFAPHTTQCIGIDLSEKMVETYNARARNQGLAKDEMIAYVGDLCVPTEGNPEAFADSRFFNFDMACVGMGFHHFDDPGLAAKRLVSRLKPGGVLMIIDFLPHGPHADHGHHAGHDRGQGHHEGHSHGHSHSHGDGDSCGVGYDGEESEEYYKAVKTVAHHGFSEERIKEIFVNAGAGTDFATERIGSVTMGMRNGKSDLFMARGTKA